MILYSLRLQLLQIYEFIVYYLTYIMVFTHKVGKLNRKEEIDLGQFPLINLFHFGVYLHCKICFQFFERIFIGLQVAHHFAFFEYYGAFTHFSHVV